LLRTIDPLPPGSLVMSDDIENLLMNYSHADRIDIVPIFSAYTNHLPLTDALRSYARHSKPKSPTIAKLLAICSFLSKADGHILKYAYQFCCDVVHAGTTATALSDVADFRAREQQHTRAESEPFHGQLSEILLTVYPSLCAETLKSIAVMFQCHMTT